MGEGSRSSSSKSEAIETRSKPLHQNVPVRPQSSPARRRTRPQSAAGRPSSAQGMLPSSAASSHNKDFLAARRRKRPQSAKPSTKLKNPFRNVDAASHFFPNRRELWNVFEVGAGDTVPVEAAIPHTHAVAATSELVEELEHFRNSRAPTVATRMDAFNRFVSIQNSAAEDLVCATYHQLFRKHEGPSHRSSSCWSPCATATHTSYRHAQVERRSHCQACKSLRGASRGGERT